MNPKPGADAGAAPEVGVLTSVIVSLGVQAGVSMIIFAPPVLAPEASRTIGIEASTVGVFTSLIYLFAACAAVSSARLVSWFGALRASQLCLASCAVGMALVSTGRLPLVLLAAPLLGLGYGPVTPASAIMLLSTVPPRYRSLVFSIKQTGVPIGAGLCGVAIPAMVAAAGWQVAALALAAAAIAIALACQPVQRQFDRCSAGSGTQKPASPFATLRLVAGQPRLRELAVGSFVFAGIQMCVVAYMVVFLTEAGGLSLATAGLAMSGAMIGGVIGRIWWGYVADNLLTPRRTLALISAITGFTSLGFALLSPSWPLPVVMILTFVSGLSSIAWNGVFLAEVAHRAPPGMATAATGGVMFCTYGGVMVWPATFYAVHAISGTYVVSFALVGTLGLAGMVMFLRRGSE